jgi:hypothetical protein
MRLVTVVGAVWLGLAGAARADTYPQIVVDRPLVLLPGMTTVDLGLDFPTYRYGTSSNTALGRYKDLDVVVDHAFGPVELGARFVDSFAGPFLSLGGSTLAGPGVVTFSAGLRAPIASSGLDHDYGESVGYAVVARVVPHLLRFDASVHLEAEQYSGVDADGAPYSHHPMAVEGSAGGTVQLVDELSFGVGVGVVIPVVDSGGASASPDVGGSLMYVVDQFDFYGHISASDLFHTPRPYAGVGIVARFGG